MVTPISADNTVTKLAKVQDQNVGTGQKESKAKGKRRGRRHRGGKVSENGELNSVVSFTAIATPPESGNGGEQVVVGHQGASVMSESSMNSTKSKAQPANHTEVAALAADQASPTTPKTPKQTCVRKAH
jgi:hypothetical protein